MGKDTKAKNSGGFSKLFDSLFGSSDPEAEKKRTLKALAKQLAKSKYKFYKTQNNVALPAMAKFFYEIYKGIAPAQTLFSNQQIPVILKNSIVDFFLSDKQKAAIERISEDALRQRANEISIADLKKQVKNDLSSISSEFPQAKIEAANALYEMLMQFVAFCSFDYFMMLKKFDPELQERKFTTPPNFQPARGQFVVDDLKDFMAVAWGLRTKDNWAQLIKFMKESREIDVMPLNTWTKILARVADLRSSCILELIVSYATSTPGYKPNVSTQSEEIFENYLNKIKTQAETNLRKVMQEKASNKSDSLLKAIFGTAEVEQLLTNYTEESNEVLTKRGKPTFKFCQPINYLKYFLLNYFKKDVREVSDLVLMRGKWVEPDQYKKMSAAYNDLLEMTNRITAFDENVAEVLPSGNKGKFVAATSVDKNNDAHLILTQAAQNMVVFAKYIKVLVEDMGKSKPEVLTNWPEVAHIANNMESAKAILVGAYKQIYNFVSLLQVYLGENKAL